MSVGIRVEGIRELRKALRDAEDIENLKEFREGLKAAAELVAEDARGRVPSVTGRAAASLRATAGGNKAYVQGGKAAVPYYGWLDFGTRNPNIGNPRSVGPWSGTGPGPAKGRFIYPALEAREDEVRAAVEKGVDAMNKKVGLT